MENMLTKQKVLIESLRTAGLKEIVWDEARGVAYYARGRFGSVGAKHHEGVRRFLSRFGALFGPEELGDVLRPVRTRTDQLGWTHLQYEQSYVLPAGRGTSKRKSVLNVERSFFCAHVDETGELVELQSTCWRDVLVLFADLLSERELAAKLSTELAAAPGLGLLLTDIKSNRRTWSSLDRYAKRSKPELVVMPFQGGFRLAWSVIGTFALRLGVNSPVQLQPGRAVIDAVSGLRLATYSFGVDAEHPDNGSGLSLLPLGGPYTNRALRITRVNTSSTYRMHDTTHSRDILTYDVAENEAYPDYFDTAQWLTAGTVPVSSDTDGDKNWNRVPADSSTSEIVASQQPEVDAHYNVGRVYDWHNALAAPGGRAGFDDGDYPSTVPSNMPVHLLTHVPNLNGQFYTNQNDAGRWVSYLSFGRSPSAAGHTAWAASPFFVAHEYQHGINAHSTGPSIPSTLGGFNDIGRALDEGLADVFGGLYSSEWYAGASISPTGNIPVRNIAYPRDPAAAVTGMRDHYDDRGPYPDEDQGYATGTVLAHSAYLMSQGGVHERVGRTPELIPVFGLGTESFEGVDLPIAARIWHRFVTSRLAPIAGDTTFELFRMVRTECLASATDLYGVGSRAYHTMRLAFYAVGLQPDGETYGSDVTFLPWGFGYRYSRPYLGLDSPNWASLDLFINNGGSSDWNAVVNASGSEVEFENSIYCRVRNVGDQDAYGVWVGLEYAKISTAPTGWQPVTDKDGIEQQLLIGTMTAGSSTFEMSAQDTPPESAGVKWYIPPLDPGEEVDHYCLRATVHAAGETNTTNNVVQSNIAYTTLVASGSHTMAFMIGNPTDEAIGVDLRVRHSLPKGWRAVIREKLDDVKLAAGEERRVHIDLERPAGSPDFEAPFDGALRGTIGGMITGSFSGLLTDAHEKEHRLLGRLSARVTHGGTLVGHFEGTLDRERGEIRGRVRGIYRTCGEQSVCVSVKACLRPHRRIDIGQYHRGEALGGVTFQVQLPVSSTCNRPTAPTDTVYRPGLIDRDCTGSHDPFPHDNRRPRHESREHHGTIVELLYDCHGAFTGFVLDTCAETFRFSVRGRRLERLAVRALENEWLVRVLEDDHGGIRNLTILSDAYDGS